MSKSFSDIDSMLSQLRDEYEAKAHERGFESWEAMDAHDAIERNAREARRIEAETRAARARAVDPIRNRLPEAVHEAVIGDTLDETPAVLAVRSWLESDRPVLILAGGPGVGKTVASAYALAKFPGRSQFVRALQIGAHWERWSSDRESNVAALDLGVALLVVDDLGQESPEDRRAHPALEEVFDARQTKRTRTLITTNMTKRQIADRYSPRLISRLAQNATMETLDGADMRRAGR